MSEGLIASERNGVNKDQELKQKQLKRGKGFSFRWINCLVLARDSQGIIMMDDVLRDKRAV